MFEQFRQTLVVLLISVLMMVPEAFAGSAEDLVLPEREPLMLAQAKKSTTKKSTEKAPAKKTPAKSSTTKKTTSKKESSKKETPKKESEEKESTSSTEKKEEKPPSPKEATTFSLETIKPAIERLIVGHPENEKWSVKVAMLESGQSVYENNPDLQLIPASTRKLFTSALVLDQLGPEFTFRTYLYYSGSIDSSGTLNGHLIIRPQGDPSFSNRLFEVGRVDWIYRDWVSKVQASGIQKVQGELLIDCSDWNMDDLKPKGWASRIIGDSYAPHTSPLTLNENIMGIIVKPGKPGQPGIIEFQPPAVGYPVVNSTVTGGKSGVSLRYTPDGQIEVRGNPNGKTYGIPCDNPTLFAAAVFRYHLHSAGVPIIGSVRIVTQKNVVPAPATENVIALYPSPPMSELVKTMMKQSNNHFAEQMYVAVSAMKGRNGGYTGSKQLESDLLKKAGIDPGKMQFEDGSGLSEANATSANQQTRLISFMMKHPASQAFFDALAVGGQDGTLRRRLQDSDTRGKVHAKTGHINRVSCLSGLVMVAPQQTAVFSILVNGTRRTPDGIQDQICELIAKLQP